MMPSTLFSSPWTRYIIGGALMALQACTEMAGQPATSSGLFRPNAALTSWQLRGKIGLRTARGADSAYLNWLQCGDRYEIRINGPLGAGAAKLVGDGHQVTLFESNRPPLTAASAEQLLLAQFGWRLPISQLIFWVKGIPSPNYRATHTDQGFEQLGWRLSYPRQTRQQQYRLPAKAIADTSDLRATLIFQQWQLQPDCEALP